MSTPSTPPLATPDHDPTEGSDAETLANLKTGVAGRLAKAFIGNKLTPLLIVSAVAIGAFAVQLLPREEEPQIKVPMVDIFIGLPGASAREVEQRVSSPVERLVQEVPGVEYVYST